MRLRYRLEGDRLYVRIEDRVEDESRVWKTLARMGAPVETESERGSLVFRKFVPTPALPKLERACRMMKWDLAPEAGEPPVASGTTARRAYEAARPFDSAPLIRAALEDPDASERTLHEARAKLVTWMRQNPSFLGEARKDLDAVDAALQKAQAEIRRRASEAQTEEARELSFALRGVAAEDAFAAHAALKRLTDAVKRFTREPGPAPGNVVDLPSAIPHFLGHLRPYQVEGVKFLLRRGLDAVLADEMGLGKTVMAIAAVEAADEKALVVGPANVLYNWAEEIHRFTDERALVYHEGRFRGPTGARFLVTTYDALRNLPHDLDEIATRPVLVLDEAHYVRNPETLRAKLVRALPQTRRLLLTGTPLVNSVEDYYELLRQVDATRWGSRSSFKETWLVDAQLFNKYAQVRSATATLLQRAAADVMLRRRKDEVLADLPPRTIAVRPHELPPDRLREYRQLEARAEEAFRHPENEVAVFAALHALRQHLAVSRIPAVLDRVRELLDAGENVVVYSHYLKPLHELRDALGRDVAATLEGATPPRVRQDLARTFGKDGGPRVLLAQMEAGGIGLNFTAARNVLFVHFGWTPAVHAQAMDRVHRIGQDRPVLVEFFVTPDTIDERMVRILLRKEADQNLVLADDSDFLNRAELARILAEDAAKRLAAEKAAAGLADGADE